MTANNTKAVFDTTASTYDINRSRLVPGCDLFYRWAVDLIPSGAKTILDLGAGSGLLTQLIRDRLPEARIHLMDFSGPMLALACQRFSDDSRISYQQADYITEPLPQSLCVIASSLSIHHVEDADKQSVFQKAYAALKPRGIFINADQVLGPTPSLEVRYKELWLEQSRAAGATEQQIVDSLYRQKEDRCASVESQLSWLRSAGFEDVDCWFKDNRFAVMAGRKPA